MNAPENPENEPAITGQVRTQHVSARVPEGVGRGVFSTGIILITGPGEFVVDFIENIGRPPQVVARVIIPHGSLPQFIDALRKNWEIYTQRFGAPAEPARPPQQQGQSRLSVQEIYDELKLPDELLSGAYANGLMIGHSSSEFKLDFLTNLYPHSAVSCRVYTSAPQIPRMIESLNTTWKQFQQRLTQQCLAASSSTTPPISDAAPATPSPPDTNAGNAPASGNNQPPSDNETQPPPSDNQPPPSDNQPPPSDNQQPPSDNEQPPSDNEQPPLGD